MCRLRTTERAPCPSRKKHDVNGPNRQFRKGVQETAEKQPNPRSFPPHECVYPSHEPAHRVAPTIFARPEKVAAGDTLSFNLVFRPLRFGDHAFSFPLSLEGIPSDGAKHLRVPVSAVGLRPTLTFVSTEVDFGRKVVSRDPCALKQYQGEFIFRNASDKASYPCCRRRCWQGCKGIGVYKYGRVGWGG